MKRTILLAFSVLLTACGSGSGGGSDPQPSDTDTPPRDKSGDAVIQNTALYQASSRPLTTAIAQLLNEKHNHYEVDVQISDGKFSYGTYLVGNIPYGYWYSENDTAWFSADLYSASTTKLENGDYTYVDITQIKKSAATVGKSVFSQAKFGWDQNGNGNIDKNEELKVVAGTISVSGESVDSLTLKYDVVLANGEKASGSYNRSFSVFD